MTNEEASFILTNIDRRVCDDELSDALDMAIKALEQQPESEIKPIGYRECSNAMLKMWMDNVLTDGEYYRIMDKLNAKWSRIAESEAKKDDKGNSRENSKRDYRQNRM